MLLAYLCLGSKDIGPYQPKCASYMIQHYGIDVFDLTVDIFLGETVDSNRYFENFWKKEVGFLIDPNYMLFTYANKIVR